MSKGEQKIHDYLVDKEITFTREKTFRGLKGDNKSLRFDFYLPKHRTCIEFDGEQHYNNVNPFDKGDIMQFEKRVRYDRLKNEYCRLNNIKIVRVRYSDMDKIPQILNKRLDKKKKYVKRGNKARKKKEKSPYNINTVVSDLRVLLTKLTDRGMLRRYIQDLKEIVDDVTYRWVRKDLIVLLDKAESKLLKVDKKKDT